VIRAILDANVYISYLIYPSGDGPPARIVRAALLRQFVPLVSPKLLEEVHEKATRKPYLASRIDPPKITELFTRIITVGDSRDDAELLYPVITRDRKDDYLITNAVVYQADFLVSGDPDLLELGEFAGIRIVSPAVFIAILDRDHDRDHTRVE